MPVLNNKLLLKSAKKYYNKRINKINLVVYLKTIIT